MTEREYRAHPAVSRSELWRLTESPEKFQYHREHPKPPSPALVFGQLLHKIVLEPDTFHEEFAVIPLVDRRTKEGKEAYQAFLEYAAPRTVVTADMVRQAGEMREAVLANGYAARLFEGARETPWFWQDELTGEECKCRTDVTVEIGGLPLIVDLKTTGNAATDPFTRDAIKYGYDFQAAMYREGVRASTGKECGFVFVVVEKEPPYSINILQADPLFLRRGVNIYRELLDIYHECRVTGNWWGYLGKGNNINSLSLPPWLARELE